LVVLREFDIDVWRAAWAEIAEFIADSSGIARIVKQLLPIVIR
jgi:hypothetical protein